jgi:hypothetical protein
MDISAPIRRSESERWLLEQILVKITHSFPDWLFDSAGKLVLYLLEPD